MANPIMKFFGSSIFTWWNSATFGTRLWTARKGVKVGEDEEGNVYYQEKNGRRRWVVYNAKTGDIEASRVPADWHGWLHYTMDTPPSQQPLARKDWEEDHIKNLTGSDAAYSPLASGVRAATTGDYEAWKPE